MATYTSDPISMIYEGEAIIPSKFIVTYKSNSANPAITFYSITEDSGTKATLGSSKNFEDTSGEYGTMIVEGSYLPSLAIFFEITNVESLGELSSVVMVTRGGASITVSS